MRWPLLILLCPHGAGKSKKVSTRVHVLVLILLLQNREIGAVVAPPFLQVFACVKRRPQPQSGYILPYVYFTQDDRSHVANWTRWRYRICTHARMYAMRDKLSRYTALAVLMRA